MNRMIAILGFVVAIAILCPILWLAYSPYSAWRNLPFARGWLHGEVLNDPTHVGSNKSEVLAKLGEPTNRQGPYSWWSLIDGDSPKQERSALMFRYDDSLVISRIMLYGVRAPEDKSMEPLSIDLDAWKDSSDEVQHRMNLDLVNKSKRGEIPAELRTLADVEKYFPRARYVDHWNYSTGMLQSIAMSFDPDGIVTEVWEGND